MVTEILLSKLVLKLSGRSETCGGLVVTFGGSGVLDDPGCTTPEKFVISAVRVILYGHTIHNSVFIQELF